MRREVRSPRQKIEIEGVFNDGGKSIGEVNVIFLKIFLKNPWIEKKVLWTKRRDFFSKRDDL